jgi:hypothetical protein
LTIFDYFYKFWFETFHSKRTFLR